VCLSTVRAYGLNEYLHGQIAAKAQAGTPNLEKTRTAGLKQADPAAGPNSQFRHAVHPGSFTSDLGYIRPIAGI